MTAIMIRYIVLLAIATATTAALMVALAPAGSGLVFSGFALMANLALFVLVAAVDHYLLPRLRMLRRRAAGADAVPNVLGGERRAPRAIVVGAGEAGRTIVVEYRKRGRDREVVGFVDDDPAKFGATVEGRRVLGSVDRLPELIVSHNVDEVIVAIPSAAGARIYRIITAVKAAHPGVMIRILPSVMRAFDAPLVPELREIDMADLIDRDEIVVDTGRIRERFGGATVLVTGAGGSIGSELCRQMLRFSITRLVAIGHGENSIYELAKNLRDHLAALPDPPAVEYRIVDIKDYALLERVFAEHRPDVVFHAAAHKHVPLMEFNEAEAVQNNVGGSYALLRLARKYRAGRFVMVSTDKAVNPTSVMGATKRITELLTLSFHRRYGLTTAIVRFGNVIGSRGSIIPLFREQIARGGPVTVTHPDVERYFMSIPEASILVINAAAYAAGGEIFVLDMGRQHRILEVAQRLIRLCGREPGRDIAITFTGLRPGEKLSEELHYAREDLSRTANDKIFLLNQHRQGADLPALDRFVTAGIKRLPSLTSAEIRREIKRIVPECRFTPEQSRKRASDRLVT